ncbi:TIGR00341 family protein [Pseudodesulfovibrio sediminis]|uniref:DUF389 domain-containing protein n=1 Tax=Pseudodesulfovibrio sediminis TaxID=2810563 RepID=A0ABM7P4Y8_9BACT|nr:TIGR00341 family protein [Pseudodesulfovibrio sediminis]BCS87975.1 DUF389 domain-containing protein [Pseudodesulfovibrio sediminis]
MPLRVIEIVTPTADKEEVVKSLEDHRPKEGYVFWATPIADEDALAFRIILNVQESEDVLDKLEHLFAWTEKYRIVVYPAEATLPRLDPLTQKKEEKEEDTPPDEDKNNGKKDRISREELYSDILDTTILSKNYLILILLSSIVAIIGLERDSVAIIIGAMVLAPLLGPNVGLALASTLGDYTLAREASKTLVIGISLCFALSVAAGLAFGMPAMNNELMLRNSITYSDMVLAFVSGAAGIVSFTMGVPTSLVGVMVALSLLPPLTASGLFLGAGLTSDALGAGLLFLANIICLNLAGVVTFLLQGIQPLSWREKEQAKATTIRVTLLWSTLLTGLILLLYFKIVL